MNITPLYNLRLRLKNAMVQGTNLLSEDFRLKRAIEEFSPLMKAAPVFAKSENSVTDCLIRRKIRKRKCC